MLREDPVHPYALSPFIDLEALQEMKSQRSEMRNWSVVGMLYHIHRAP